MSFNPNCRNWLGKDTPIRRTITIDFSPATLFKSQLTV